MRWSFSEMLAYSSCVNDMVTPPDSEKIFYYAELEAFL